MKTYMTEEIDERIDAGIAHSEPMADEPNNVNVLEAVRKSNW